MIEKFELYKYSDYAASDYAWSTVDDPVQSRVNFVNRLFMSRYTLLIILCQCLLRTGAGEGSPVFPHGCGETVTRVSARVWGDGHLSFSSGAGRRSPVF